MVITGLITTRSPGVIVMDGLVKRLERDWSGLEGGAAMTSRYAQWVQQEPVLGQWASVRELRTTTEDRSQPARSDSVLAALARLAAVDGGDDPLAARTLLQLLLPGAVSLARRLRGCYAGDPVEAEASVLAELTAKIKTYPWQRRPHRVAANLLLDTQHALLAEARRHRDITVGLDGAGTPEPSADAPEISARLEIIEIFAWATREGVLSREEAGLVAANRVDEVPIAELAVRTGRSQPTLFRIRARAETALRSALLAREYAAA